MLLGDQRAAVFAVGEPAVRAGAYARIFAIAPVEQVVAGFLAGHGVVGNLVGGQARLLRQFLREVVEIGGTVVRRGDKGAALGRSK